MDPINWVDVFTSLRDDRPGSQLAVIADVSGRLLRHKHHLAAATIAVHLSRMAQAFDGLDAGVAGRPGDDPVQLAAAAGLVLARRWDLSVLDKFTGPDSQLRLGYVTNAKCDPADGQPAPGRRSESARVLAAGAPGACALAIAENWRAPGTPAERCAGRSQLHWVAYCASAPGDEPVQRAAAGLAAGELAPELALAIICRGVRSLQAGPCQPAIGEQLERLAELLSFAFDSPGVPHPSARLQLPLVIV